MYIADSCTGPYNTLSCDMDASLIIVNYCKQFDQFDLVLCPRLEIGKRHLEFTSLSLCVCVRMCVLDWLQFETLIFHFLFTKFFFLLK